MITLATRKYKVGYEIRVDWIKQKRGSAVIVRSAYTPKGHYIGSPKMARFLIVKRGIRPELVDEAHEVCSIGYCEREQKWYGWSHRAICGFGAGDVVAEHPEDDSSLPVGFVAKDLIDAKRMAMAFAESIG